jgi:hypothetical protein
MAEKALFIRSVETLWPSAYFPHVSCLAPECNVLNYLTGVQRNIYASLMKNVSRFQIIKIEGRNTLNRDLLYCETVMSSKTDINMTLFSDVGQVQIKLERGK